MKRHVAVGMLTTVLMLGLTPASAGPIEEVAELGAKRGKAFSEGNGDVPADVEIRGAALLALSP